MFGFTSENLRCCISCRKYKPVSEFYMKPGRKIGKQYPSALCKICDGKRTSKHIQKMREKIVTYGGGCCKICGYSRCINALEFHHRNPNTKELNIARLRGLNDRAKEEIAKCDLVCANCHREIHADLYRKRL